MTRREIFNTAAATPVAAAFVLADPIAVDPLEQELRSSLPLLADLRKQHVADAERVNELERVYYEGLPRRPALMRRGLHACGARSEYSVVIEDGVRCSNIADTSIEKMRTAARLATGDCVEDGDAVIMHGGDHTPQTEAGQLAWAAEDAKARIKVAALIAAYDGWKSECKAFADRIGYTAADQAYDESAGAYFAEFDRLTDIKVRTLMGFALKAKVISTYGFKEDEKAEALLADLLAFAG